MTTQHSLAGVVHEERLKLKMAQQHFGAIGDANADAQYKYERGSRIPKTDYLVRVAQVGRTFTTLPPAFAFPRNSMVDELSTAFAEANV